MLKTIGFAARSTPTIRLALVLVVAILVSGAAWRACLEQRGFDAAPQPGAHLVAGDGSMVIEDLDLTPEPGELATYGDVDRFYARQNLLHALQARADVQLVVAPGQAPTAAKPRTVGDTPALFWIQLAVGVGALVISGWIWALRPQDLPSRLFALSGLATLAFTASAAIYSTRALALPAGQIEALALTNMVGASVFGVAVVGLFLVYPRRLVAWRQLMAADVLGFGCWTALAALRWLPSPQVGGNLITLVEMVGIVVAIIAQHRATRGHPQERAALTWLGLSVMIGAGSFIVLSAAPSVLGLTLPLAQGYAFLFFLVIYLGLAAGLRRYRLFNVGQWGARALFYTLGAALVMALDGVLVLALNVQREPAFGLALLGVSLAYLPLRDHLWRLTTRRKPVETHDLLAATLDVAFTTDVQRAERWVELLRRFFDPLLIESAGDEVSVVRADPDGSALYVPDVAGAGSLRLAYAASGRALFRPDDLKLAAQLIDLTRRAESGREAYDRGVTEERRRIAQDLHDDVGARLLSGLYLADEHLRPTLRAAISDVRTIVAGITGERAPLSRLVADLRHETQQRLESADIAMDWSLPAIADDGPLLDWRQHKAFGSSVREVVSNVLRHSGASRLSVGIAADQDLIVITLKDDGRGIPAAALAGESGGFGLTGVRRRMAEIGGQAAIESDDSGALIRLQAPLRLGR